MATLMDILGGGLPAGLLSPEQEAAAQQRAQNALLVNFAFGALQASRGAPGQRAPSLAQIIGQAGPVGVAGYQQSFENTLSNALRSMQVQEMRRKQAEQENLRLAREKFAGRMSELQGGVTTPSMALAGGGGPTQAAAESIGQPIPQADLLRQQQAASLEFLGQVAPEEVAKLAFREPKEPKALPASIQEYQFAVGQGYKGTYQDFVKEQKQAGAPSTKIEVKTGESIGAQVGPMLKDSQIAASGAALQIDAADRIIDAVNTGKVLSGPGTTPVLRAAQFGNVLGITGKDTNETIANTRRAIRGLAELTLQGRKSMRGEGAITESEGKLAEKAFSGDIADLTNDEIRILANSSKRAAQFTVKQHEKRLDVLRKNPDTAQLVPFYEVNIMPTAPSAGGIPAGVTVRRKQ